MSTMHPLLSIILFVLTISLSHAQDAPPDDPPTIAPVATTSLEPATKPSLSPPNAPIVTPAPTDFECSNTPGWFLEFSAYSNCSWTRYQLDCDDEIVDCLDDGYLGPASLNCCKCKSQCSGQCKDPISTVPTTIECEREDDFYSDQQEEVPITFGTGMVILCIMCIGLHQCNQEGQHDARWEANRQTMANRREEQRQNNSQGLTEEERNHARYELFRSKFHFQEVLPDKSNISASSLRNASTNLDEEIGTKDDVVSERPPKRPLSKQLSKISLSIRQLSSWRRTTTKDECCICLENYSVGETICAAITKECDHVFHEGCMLQWVKNNDKCPLCRVDVVND